MADSFSPDSYHRFEQSVKRSARYVHEDEVNDLLALVMKTAESRTRSIEQYQVLWRAQRGYTWRKENEGEEYESQAPCAFDPERMKPKAEYVGDGRVNPRGIPCLYLASSQDTAMPKFVPRWVLIYRSRSSG
jgi:hypothetical protein